MAASTSRKRKSGGDYCVAGGPNKVSCTNNSYTDGISMHYFPKNEAVRIKWMRFVQKHRKDFVPSKKSCLCSAHFDKSCYENRPIPFSDIPDMKQPPTFKRYLIKGSVPTKDVAGGAAEMSTPPSARKRRQILRDLKDTPLRHTLTASPVETLTTSNPTTTSSPSSPVESTSTCTWPSPAVTPTPPVLQPTTTSTQKLTCFTCTGLRQKYNLLRRKHNRSKKWMQALKDKVKHLQNVQREPEMETEFQDDQDRDMEEETVVSSDDNDNDDDDDDSGDYDDMVIPTNDESELNEDPDWATQEECIETGHSGQYSSDDDDEESDQESQRKGSRNKVRFEAGQPVHEEPKFIVFLSMLMTLFTMVCFNCKKNKPTVSVKHNGTMVTVLQHCPKCGENAFKWQSQPLVLGKYPAGNILLSFAVLMAGASVSKVLLVFRHMGLCVYNVRTYFIHQKKFLFPVILQHWERYQAALVENIKKMKDVVWCGDGRFDSMGHSAKYGAYTMFCSSSLKVVHFEILQANETGGSSPMELEGAKRAFDYLARVGISIPIFISDRHRGIAKWIRECKSSTLHFYDIWHVARSIDKVLLKLSKEKGCERIKEWMKGIRTHLYWCATSTKQGFEELILAKWKSFMHHVTNKHENHPDPLFKKCLHGDIERRKWIYNGTKAYQKLNVALMKTKLQNDIKKLSPDAQTSSLEGFHATLNHWHPKMICFSWLGTYCRHTLATLHFNENVHRETHVCKNGKDYVRIIYPKYKMGEEVVRGVAVPPTYNYVEEMRTLLFSMSAADISALQTVTEKYSAKTPPPLTSQFSERKSKDEALKAHEEKKTRTAAELFPTVEEQEALQAKIQATLAATSKTKQKRKVPTCRKCGQPKKGHPKSSCG